MAVAAATAAVSIGLALGLAPVEAPGHVFHKRSNGALQWYFGGKTRTDNSKREVKDPINLIFYKGGVLPTRTRVENHLNNEWAASRTMKPSTCPFQHEQRMTWKLASGENITTDVNDMSSAQHNGCSYHYPAGGGSGYHFRGWDDQEHDLNTSGHGRQDQWMVGAIHYDTPRHRVGTDWDQARAEATIRMNNHCTIRRWRRHPGARGLYQKIRSSGWLARISMRHRIDGCKGA